MWLVTQHGFFNIVQSDDDEKKGLLTIKARRREDLVDFGKHTDAKGPIQESMINDYRFRMKAPRELVASTLMEMIDQIDYPKTKGRLAHTHPDRTATYLTTWFTLLDLQDDAD